MRQTIPVLLARGNDVVGVDNVSRHGRSERIRSYEFIEQDLTDAKAVERPMSGVDGVVQGTATLYGVGGVHADPATIL